MLRGSAKHSRAWIRQFRIASSLPRNHGKGKPILFAFRVRLQGVRDGLPKAPRGFAFDPVGIVMHSCGFGVRSGFDSYRRGPGLRAWHVRRLGGVAHRAWRSRHYADHAYRTRRTDAPDVAGLDAAGAD